MAAIAADIGGVMLVVLLILTGLLIGASYTIVQETSKSERVWVVLGFNALWIVFVLATFAFVLESSVELKQECEKDLLRSEQCVMMFVPEKKGE